MDHPSLLFSSHKVFSQYFGHQTNDAGVAEENVIEVGKVPLEFEVTVLQLHPFKGDDLRGWEDLVT